MLHLSTNYLNLCFTSDTQTLFFLYSNKPTNSHSFLHLFRQTLNGDFLGWERKSTTKLVPLPWGKNADDVGELYLNFFIFWCVGVFSLLLGVAEFCINKISMELCGFVCGFCIFVWLVCGFLSISFNSVGLSFCLCLYLDVWVSFGFFYVGLCPPVNSA